MVAKKDLIGNELMKEIISIRFDTMWKMLALRKGGYFPKPDEEGAAGEFDNKGAIFVPGGFIFADSDRRAVKVEKLGELDGPAFRKKIREAMRFDNAILFYPEGMAVSVNLDNGFFSEMAGHILAIKQAALKRKPIMANEPPPQVDSRDITRSYCPFYMEPPYGSRTKLSSCLAACLIESRMYFIQCRNAFGLRSGEDRQLWENIRTSRRPIIGRDKKVLAPPYVVVCHTTRYRENALGGMTRILGFGKFGEFASFALEEVTSELLNEIGGGKTQIRPTDVFAEVDDLKVVGVLRTYSPTTPGKRRKKFTTRLVSPSRDLELNLEDLAQEAMERYKLV